ncbi:PaaI family thioesterase [Paenibacillus elgii]
MDNQASAFLNRLEQAARGTFWEHIGARIDTFAPDRASVSLSIKPHHHNLIGIAHGGVHATLLDSAMGLVAMAVKPNENVVTTNLNLHYLAPIAKGEMRVTAEIIHSSGRMITMQGHVYDEEGQLCAFGTGTFRIVEWRGNQ